MADMHFHDEAEALAEFQKREGAWCCTLFVTADGPDVRPGINRFGMDYCAIGNSVAPAVAEAIGRAILYNW